ncbi:ribosomal protein L35 [Cryptococcus bacillisporus CA1873]|uniref:Ribosomal protein L35 n=1 Tax=Cryptococcus bacillisporus CA1873 TaxID=1296111 RepID=A0ABR5BJC0_CRYGA|nr:ribosomal protein L35 [Cryptococcus bacillisporus CA1873]|eukprot:KIR69256.1 ribosomal protein L35 [Cryptococcus gattii CA1873]
MSFFRTFLRPSSSIIPNSQPLLNLSLRQPQINAFSTTSSTLVKQKLKSHSSSKKRFFPNASGMFKRAQAGKSHLNTAFSASRVNRLAKGVYVTNTQTFTFLVEEAPGRAYERISSRVYHILDFRAGSKMPWDSRNRK